MDLQPELPILGSLLVEEVAEERHQEQLSVPLEQVSAPLEVQEEQEPLQAQSPPLVA